MERILAVDYGRRRTGLAVCDPLGITTQPLKTLDGTPERAIATIAALVKEREVERIVVGLPLRLDGTDSDMTREARAFAVTLKQAAGVPVELLDERWSSAGAEHELRSVGLTPGKHKDKIDALAACEILRARLDGAKGIEV